MLADEIPDTAPGATWAIDHSHVFYMTVDESWRPDTVWRHKLGNAAESRCFGVPRARRAVLGFGAGLPAARST